MIADNLRHVHEAFIIDTHVIWAVCCVFVQTGCGRTSADNPPDLVYNVSAAARRGKQTTKRYLYPVCELTKIAGEGRGRW